MGMVELKGREDPHSKPPHVGSYGLKKPGGKISRGMREFRAFLPDRITNSQGIRLGREYAQSVSSMNATRIRNRFGGFTLIELLTVIAIIGILAAMLLPVLSRSKARARRIQCVSGLREIGQGFLLFANDHGGKFPMQVSTNDGGSLEYVTANYQAHSPFTLSYHHFLSLASELSTPNLLACPADSERLPAVNFSAFNNWNLSYDAGFKTDPGLPGAILACDRTLPTCPTPMVWSERPTSQSNSARRCAMVRMLVFMPVATPVWSGGTFSMMRLASEAKAGASPTPSSPEAR